VGTAPAQVAPRVVFDTTVVVSTMLFPDGRLAWIRKAWSSGAAVPVVSRSTVQELIRVLAYPKFKLTAAEREELLGDYLPHAEVCDKQHAGVVLPKCRDPNDQMFIELAAAADADALVTGDADLLAVAKRFTIPVLTPEQWREKIGR